MMIWLTERGVAATNGMGWPGHQPSLGELRDHARKYLEQVEGEHGPIRVYRTGPVYYVEGDDGYHLEEDGKWYAPSDYQGFPAYDEALIAAIEAAEEK